MRITLRQLEAFFWTAKLGSVRAAGEHLNFSQPAVSIRLRELERALDVALFERSGARLQLTPAGRNAVAFAERALRAGREFEQLGQHEPVLDGVLRLGSDELTAMVALPEILQRLKQQHPRLVVEITINVGTVLQDKLRKREIDMALHTHGGGAAHVVDELLGWVDFQWVGAAGLELPDGVLTPQVAQALTVMTNSPPSTLHTLVRQWLRSGGFAFDALNSCNSLWLMLRLVQEGYAIAILPTAILHGRDDAALVRVLPCDPPIAPVAYYASRLQHDGSAATVPVAAIARSVLSAARFFVPPPAPGGPV